MTISVGDYFTIGSDTSDPQRVERLVTLHDGGVEQVYVICKARTYRLSDVARVPPPHNTCYFADVLPLLDVAAPLRIRRHNWPWGRYIGKIQQVARWNSATQSMEPEVYTFTYVLIDSGHVVNVEWRPTADDMVADDWVVITKPDRNLL